MRFAAKFAVGIVAVAAVGGLVAYFLTEPQRLSAAELGQVAEGDAGRGERIFYAGGCASCHARPGAAGDAALELAGGVRLASAFGTFVAPNISPHPQDGIGGWSFADFANAMQRGVSPGGSHYYPAFPYTSYARMELPDVADLHAFMKTLPAVEGDAGDHEIGFPFNVRRGVGLWKLLYLSPTPVVQLADDAPEQVRHGRYLVEGPGHCGECHTPRDMIGGLKLGEWLAGAAAPAGDGIIPNITPNGRDIGGWSAGDIAEYLSSGFTPEFDSAGGEMAAVVRNTARLTDDDRAAIAAYLKAVPGRENGYPARGRQ